jgi:glutathione S-transferase
MITLFHAPQSRSSRIVWMLEELGVRYEIRPVSIFRPMTGEGQPDVVNPHPDKRVPAIFHDGMLLAESVAIVLYLADTFPDARCSVPASGGSG